MRRRILHGGQAGDARTAGGRRIAANAALVLAMRVLLMAAGLITLPLLTRTLGPEQFGTWAAALGYVTLFSSFTELGLTNAATVKMSADPEHEAEWLGALSSIRAVLALAVTLACLAGIPLFLSDDHHLREVALIVTLTIPAACAASVIAVFQSRLRGGIPLAITAVQSAVWLVIVVILASAHAGVLTVAAANTGLIVVISAIQVLVSRRHASISLEGGRPRRRELLALALPIGVGGILVTVYYKLDAVLVFQLAGAQQAGIYGAAYRFLDPLTFLPAAVVSSFAPVLAATHGGDPERTRRLVRRCFELMAVLGLPAIAVGLVLAPQIVRLLFGDAYSESAGVLTVLLIAFAAICFGNLGGYLAPIVGLRWRIAQIAFAGAAVNVGLNLAFVPSHGAMAAAWATVVTEVLTMALLLGSGLRRLHLRPPLRRPLLATVAAAAMTGVMAVAEPLGLLPALVAGGLAYAGALLMLRVIDPGELRALRS